MDFPIDGEPLTDSMAHQALKVRLGLRLLIAVATRPLHQIVCRHDATPELVGQLTALPPFGRLRCQRRCGAGVFPVCPQPFFVGQGITKLFAGS
jgi:hypothetical protein